LKHGIQIQAAARLPILKRLGVAWRLAQQLDLRLGPVEAHGPVNPDRFVSGIGDDHQRLNRSCHRGTWRTSVSVCSSPLTAA
jgi:hypothetical protein